MNSESRCEDAVNVLCPGFCNCLQRSASFPGAVHRTGLKDTYCDSREYPDQFQTPRKKG